MISAQNVADYFLDKVDETIGDGISNLKLQKLVYYAQGFHLALHDEPLFSEPIKAWQHGPVVESLYHTYSELGSGSLPKPDVLRLVAFDDDTREVLDEVWNVYGQFSAWKLRDMTHAEPPWNETPLNDEIPEERMRDYFKTLLVNG